MKQPGRRFRRPSFPMRGQRYCYFADVSRANGKDSLGQFRLDLDLEPVAECGRFAAMRRWSDAALALEAELRIQPLWHTEVGAPYVGGLRVTARQTSLPEVSVEIPTAYFKPTAMRIADALVRQRKLEPGELFTYAVLAFPEAVGAQGANPLGFEEVPVPVSLAPGSLAEELARSVSIGTVDGALLPAFVPQRVIDEVVASTEQAQDLEVGAVLIGNLHRDAASGELFLKVSAQIPARHALSESAKLSFTADTWAAVQAALELRQSGEQWVGFFHNHPARYWCTKECAAEARQQCALNTPFFSRADCDLHRVAFVKAHCVALLVTNTFFGMKLTMYGWDRAQIVQRGFHITEPNTARPLPSASRSTIGAEHHETSCHS